MACQCAPALLKLRDEVNARWPKRDKASDGCCASSAHSKQNPKSDHEPTNGYAHALDIDENLSPDIDSLAFLKPVLLADSRCRYVIYEGRIAYPDGTDKPYTGVNAHAKHLHLSIKGTATFETRSWLSGLDEPHQEEDMPPAPAVVNVSYEAPGGPVHKRWFFMRGTDGHLYGGEGAPSKDYGGRITSGPSASARGNGLIDVTARGADEAGSAWVVTIDARDGAVVGKWASVGGKS